MTNGDKAFLLRLAARIVKAVGWYCQTYGWAGSNQDKAWDIALEQMHQMEEEAEELEKL